MEQYIEQTERIKRKLEEARRVDEDKVVFGASSHKYKLKNAVSIEEVKAFEEEYGVSLPSCYKAFVTMVGNGGVSSRDSGAGPFYGIYPFGVCLDNLIFDNPERYLSRECILFPDMTDEYWSGLTKEIDDNEEISNADFEKEQGKLFAGVLPIGSQGCTYVHGIILNGSHRGKVVNLDIDRQKPFFTYESNFLDWYERWLDEIISGDLIKMSPSNFGYTMGGTSTELFNKFLCADDEKIKLACLSGIAVKAEIDSSVVEEIEKQIPLFEGEIKTELIMLLIKSDYFKAKPYLKDLANSDLLSFAQFIFWYAKDKSIEWLDTIESHIDSVSDDETFRFCTYILTAMNVDYSRIITPFTLHRNDQIRVTAIYTLGLLGNKSDFVDVFIQGLKDSTNRVVHTSLQALSGVKDIRLLKYYKMLAEKYPVEQDYILANLEYRLKEFDLNLDKIKSLDVDSL